MRPLVKAGQFGTPGIRIPPCQKESPAEAGQVHPGRKIKMKRANTNTKGHPPRDAPTRRHRTRHRPPQGGSPHAPQLSHRRHGDRINAVLAAAGYNFSLLLRWFEELLRVLSLILWHALLAASLHLTRCRKPFFTAD